MTITKRWNPFDRNLTDVKNNEPIKAVLLDKWLVLEPGPLK